MQGGTADSRVARREWSQAFGLSHDVSQPASPMVTFDHLTLNAFFIPMFQTNLRAMLANFSTPVPNTQPNTLPRPTAMVLIY
jgi:hypothetical protein